MGKKPTNSEMNELEEYTQLMIEESTNTLKLMEDSIEKIENNVTDKLLIVDFYRVLHNFKGMAGTSGIIELEKFFHNYESLVSLIQDGIISIDYQIIDLFYESIDVIENIFANLKENTPYDEIITDFNKKIDEIKNLSPENLQEIQNKKRMKELFSQYGLQEFKLEAKQSGDSSQKFFYITIWLDPEIRLKTARLLVIIRNLSEVGQIAASFPKFEALMSGSFELSFSLLLQSSSKESIIQEKIYSSGEVVNVIFEELNQIQVQEILSPKEEKLEKEEKALTNSTKIESVNVDLGVMDELLEIFGELLISSKQLGRKLEDIQDASTHDILFDMQNYLFSLQDIVLQMQLVPLASIIRIYPRMIRNFARRENKSVKLIINHNNIRVDRKLINKIGEIINHLLRNAVYHGIELEETRKKAKKDIEGQIKLNTSLTANVLTIIVEDDGKGIDVEALGKKAIELNLYSPDDIASMNKSDLMNLIFHSNFSTAKQADLTSGRGLGLKIVQEKIRTLGGSIEVISKIGEMTRFVAQIPLTRSLIRALLVEVCDQIYSIPLDDIQNLIEISKDDIKLINNQEYIVLAEKNEVLRLHYIKKIFKIEEMNFQELKTNPSIKAIHIKKGDKNYALVVDEFLKETEIVIKKIENMPKDLVGVSGAAILDDGKVSLIIDPFSVVN